MELSLKEKYNLYIQAVQSPQTDVLFYQEKYKELIYYRSGQKLTLREDFCGTGIISTEWVKLNKNFYSYGIDLDPEPMAFGQEEFVSKLSTDQQKRIKLIKKNVLSQGLPKSDIVAAVNFSYFLFKDRSTLKDYFRNVFKSLNKKGVFVIDIFGGSQCMDAITDKIKHKKFVYYWEQKGFDPVTNFANFSINFKVGNQMYKDVFTYDWRMWSISELREIMDEVGFKETKVYWEGTNRLGGGNGVFSEVEKGEACLSWIAYIVGVKK